MSSENKTDTGSADKPRAALTLDYRKHARAAVYDGLNDYEDVLAERISGDAQGTLAEGIAFEKMSYAEAEELSEQSNEPGFGEEEYMDSERNAGHSAGDRESELPPGEIPEAAAEEPDRNERPDGMSEEQPERMSDERTDGMPGERPDRIFNERSGEMPDERSDDGIAVWECGRCGSRMLGAKDFKGFLCPFCNGLMEVEPKKRAENWASYIVPFRKTREDAVEAFRRMERQGLIRTSKSPMRMERNIYGMYIPFYLCSGDVSGRVEYHRNYRGTHEMPVKLNRFGGVTLRGVPQDALNELPDTMIDTIGPFDSRCKERFRTEHLFEHPASVATETIREMSGRIRSKMESAARSAFVLDQEEPDGMTARSSRLHTTNMDFERAYLPVYFTVAPQGKRKVWFVMNGQTGRAAVLEPMSERRMERYCRWVLWTTFAVSMLLMIMFLILEFLSIRANYVWAAALLTVMIGISANLSMREEMIRKQREWKEGVAIDALWYAHRVDFRDDF